MRIKLDEPIRDYKGQPIKVSETSEEHFTYFDVFVNALNNQITGELLTAEEKNKMYQITRKMYSDKNPNFTTDQLTLLKERVGKIYPPLVYGRVCDLVDGREDEYPLSEQDKEDIKESEEAVKNGETTPIENV